MELLKKITMKDIGTSDQLADVKRAQKEVELADISGVATGIKSSIGVNGESIGLTGDFLARNVATGEEFRSTVLYMPDIAQKLVIEALRDSDGGVELAFTITAKPDLVNGQIRTTGTGYKFGAKPLRAPAADDKLSRMRAALPERKAISAPTQETHTTPEPATAPAAKPVSAPAPAPAKKK